MLHITIHESKKCSKSKLDGLVSISTNPKVNPICIKRQESGKDCICAHCFANRFIGWRKGLKDNLEENFKILNSHEFTWEEAASVNIPVQETAETIVTNGIPIVVPKVATPYVRFESFGDVASVTHAINYVKIAITHPTFKFGWWTKNYEFVRKAFEIYRKPDNLSLVLSSPQLNTPYDTILPYVDHVFTVYTPEVIKSHEDGFINCGGEQCKSCLKCYEHNNTYFINEKLK